MLVVIQHKDFPLRGVVSLTADMIKWKNTYVPQESHYDLFSTAMHRQKQCSGTPKPLWPSAVA